MATDTRSLLDSWDGKAGSEVSIDDALEQALAGCETLRIALEQQDPCIGSFLNMINTQLRQFPELIHLIPDADKASIVQAHLKKKLEYLDAKSKPKPRKSSSSATLAEGGIVADLL